MTRMTQTVSTRGPLPKGDIMPVPRMRISGVFAAGVFLWVFLWAERAPAQPLGAFSWQLQPFCNVVTLNVTQHGAVYTLDGFDDQCGASVRASAAGVAFPNPDGTIGIGLTIVETPTAQPLQVDVRINVATLSGTWLGDTGVGGTFAFNAATGGPSRPPSGTSVFVTQFGAAGQMVARRAQGTAAAPAAVTTGLALGVFGGAGHTGSGFSGASASMQVLSTENWTATARGSRISFLTTPNGSATALTRMTIAHDGNVGIGTTTPLSPLHVNGEIRVGSCTIQTDGDILCLSDARFKRALTPLPRMLDRLVSLEPVRYYWRTNEFPERGFGAGESLGLVAQDVERVLPELVTTDPNGYKAVNYGKLPIVAVQAVKELKGQVDALVREHAALAARLAELEAKGGR
jgi:Chaperone of endosialidase